MVSVQSPGVNMQYFHRPRKPRKVKQAFVEFSPLKIDASRDLDKSYQHITLCIQLDLPPQKQNGLRGRGVLSGPALN